MLPGEVLAYDPARPAMDTLTRDACMQVDPALSKIANRFLLDFIQEFRIVSESLVDRLRPAELWCGSYRQ